MMFLLQHTVKSIGCIEKHVGIGKYSPLPQCAAAGGEGYIYTKEKVVKQE